MNTLKQNTFALLLFTTVLFFSCKETPKEDNSGLVLETEVTKTESVHLETFKAVAQGKGWPTQISITDTEWTIKTDEPVEDGGSNTGPNPMQLFIASLAGCQNEQAQVVADELSLNISQIDIKAEIDLDLSGFMGTSDNSNGSYKNVRLEAVVTGEVTDEQVKALGQKVDDRCPILALLRTSGCNIESSWSRN